MALHKLFIFTLFLIVAILAVVQITASNFLTTDGIDLAQIKKEVAQIKKENIILREQIYTLSSLTEVASKAAALGFVPEKDTVFINSSQPLAIKP